LENKILTWDNGKKRNWNGSRWCVLSRDDNKVVDHILVAFVFSNLDWKEILHLTNEKNQLENNIL